MARSISEPITPANGFHRAGNPGDHHGALRERFFSVASVTGGESSPPFLGLFRRAGAVPLRLAHAAPRALTPAGRRGSHAAWPRVLTGWFAGIRAMGGTNMTNTSETRIMALFCDFENIAIGVRDANYARFDIHKVIEKLLLKGNIVVKKAYSDWNRYAAFKAAMHEAAFELIEVPHVRQSGKNSADIRMVVDALDLCYTKPHVDTFVVISGDSDFSPLVSKLRENNKTVIGVGVKNSTSDLLIANCDEFIYYDDLVRRAPAKTPPRRPPTRAKPTASESGAPAAAASKPADSEAEKKQEALDLIVETYEALISERGEGEKIWGSMIKQTLKRRKPGFNESYYGFGSFNEILQEAAASGALAIEADEKSGGYIVKGRRASAS
jgi:uncharacterized protein (TIGR00288 family)